VVGCNLCGFAEGAGDFGGVCFGIFAPPSNAEFSRIDTNHAIFSNAVLFKDIGDAAGHPDCIHELFAGRVVAHGGVSDGARPDGCHQ
jgi:hypothetical protein